MPKSPEPGAHDKRLMIKVLMIKVFDIHIHVDSADIVVKPVTFIINTSLRTSKVPCDWKSARVIPLFKKGKADEMDNYRPISILPVLSKVLERAVHIQLYKYLQQHKILSPYQCGFRKCHSTEFAALSFSDNIRRNMDQGQLTGAVFIDLRKAFDTVDHAVLLDKLSNLGIVDKEHGWFTDYLSNRTQVVEFQGVTLFCTAHPLKPLLFKTS